MQVFFIFAPFNRYEDFAKEPVYRASILYQWIGLISEEVR